MGFLGQGRRGVLTTKTWHVRKDPALTCGQQLRRGGRRRTQAPGPCLSLSCRERNMTGAAPGTGSGPGAGPRFPELCQLFLAPGHKRKKFKLPPAAAALHTRLFLLPKDWALIQLREGNREGRWRVGVGVEKRELFFFH